MKTKIFCIIVMLLLVTGCGMRMSMDSEDTPPSDSSVSTSIIEVPATPSSTDFPIPSATEDIGTEDEIIPEASPEIESVSIVFDYTRMSTHASNQIAVWIEDGNGNLVKTLSVTSFTGSRRGYRNREDALCAWVEKSHPEAMTDAELDAITSATPSSGKQEIQWNLTDANGDRVPDGLYHLYLEGTLFWSSNILYFAELDLTNALPDTISVAERLSEPDNQENVDMLTDVAVIINYKELLLHK